jgi:hypothetical protein
MTKRVIERKQLFCHTMPALLYDTSKPHYFSTYSLFLKIYLPSFTNVMMPLWKNLFGCATYLVTLRTPKQ